LNQVFENGQMWRWVRTVTAGRQWCEVIGWDNSVSRGCTHMEVLACSEAAWVGRTDPEGFSAESIFLGAEGSRI
jgi:hypothetical protein